MNTSENCQTEPAERLGQEVYSLESLGKAKEIPLVIKELLF